MQFGPILRLLKMYFRGEHFDEEWMGDFRGTGMTATALYDRGIRGIQMTDVERGNCAVKLHFKGCGIGRIGGRT